MKTLILFFTVVLLAGFFVNAKEKIDPVVLTPIVNNFLNQLKELKASGVSDLEEMISYVEENQAELETVPDVKEILDEILENMDTSLDDEDEEIAQFRRKRQTTDQCTALDDNWSIILSTIAYLEEDIARLQEITEILTKQREKLQSKGLKKRSEKVLSRTQELGIQKNKKEIAKKEKQIAKLTAAKDPLMIQRNAAGCPGTCGTFFKYDPVNGRTAPEVNGVAGGVNYDNSIQYVGYGNGNCISPDQNPSPGNISTSLPAPGVYITCPGGLKFDNVTAHYLLKNPKQQWVGTNVNNFTTVANAVKLTGKLYEFLYGRALIDGQYKLGKIYTNFSKSANGILYIQDSAGTMFLRFTYEILVCNP